MIDADLLDLLACPACRAALTDEGDRLVCTSCGLRYPVRDGLPILLVDEAERPGAGAPEGAGPGRS